MTVVALVGSKGCSVTDGSWSDYVADAGTDAAAIDTTATDMSDAASAVTSGVDGIDTSALPDDAGSAITDAGYDASQAGSWSDWAQGDLGTAASWQDTAAGDVQDAQSWLAYGNVDGYEEAMGSAQTAMDIAGENVSQASTDAGIGAEYMDGSVSGLDTAATDLSSVDATTSYDASASYDAGAAAVESAVDAAGE